MKEPRKRLHSASPPRLNRVKMQPAALCRTFNLSVVASEGPRHEGSSSPRASNFVSRRLIVAFLAMASTFSLFPVCGQSSPATTTNRNPHRVPRSVVKVAYKLKYKLRAKEQGLRGKAAKRSTWDWVAQRMAEQTLTKKAKTDVPALYDFLHVNEVDTSSWTNRSPGWEGRLRMTGGLALRRIVAERGTLFLRDGDEIEVPEAEMERLVTQ
jgi:hypothetical protein